LQGVKKITAKPIDTRFSKFNAQRVFLFGENMLKPNSLTRYLDRKFNNYDTYDFVVLYYILVFFGVKAARYL